LNQSPVPVPVQAPVAQPAQVTHCPLAQSASLVHQHETPAASHVTAGDVTSLQLPLVQPNPVGVAVTTWQPETSGAPVPEQVPTHCAALTHSPLGHSESATQTHPVRVGLHTGAGDRVVTHE
jgi:hypothetical protein